jgi:hypothetical protein
VAEAAEPRRVVMSRERPMVLRAQGAGRVALWRGNLVARPNLTWQAVGCATCASVAMFTGIWSYFASPGLTATLVCLATAAVAVPVLANSIYEWARHNLLHWKLDRFNSVYRQSMEALNGGSLGPLIADDEVWRCLFDTGLSGGTRALVQAPRTAAERLVYAAVFWDALAAYTRGQREGFDLDVARRQTTLRLWLSDYVLPELTSLTSLARFCAVYDFFHGEEQAG